MDLTPSYVLARRAAYRALTAYRISAAERDTIAGQIAGTLTELPVDLLLGLITLGNSSGTVGSVVHLIPTYVTTDRRREAAGAAVTAAAQAIVDKLGEA